MIKKPYFHGKDILAKILLFFLVSYIFGKILRNATADPKEGKVFMELEERLKDHVMSISEKIGERHYLKPENLQKTIEYIKGAWKKQGYLTNIQTFKDDEDNEYSNLWVEAPGSGASDKIIVVGAHYDTVEGTPGADDNTSGVAALLEISAFFRHHTPGKTVRFVAFANEEPPFFHTKYMGSYVYAREAKARGENVMGMIALETIGYYKFEPKTQKYPFPINLIYPDTGNFIGVVGNFSSRPFNRAFVKNFKKVSDFPIESISTFSFVQGVDWSDHSSFWQFGYPAIMVTDTALFRNPYYHTERDTVGKLDFKAFSKVTYGLYLTLKKMSL